MTLTALPLTRQVLAWWPRWRAADERRREHLRTFLSPSAVETLLRLESNVHAARTAKSRTEVLTALLSGLLVPEPARVVSDLARAVYPEAGEWDRDLCRYSALEAALREHLKVPREKPAPPTSAPVGKPTLPQKPAYSWRGNPMTVNADKISREKLTGMVAVNGLPHHQDEEPEAVEPEASTPTAADPWPWSTQDLTPRQEEVFEALRKRDLRPDCIVPAVAQREIAREMKTTPGSVGFHLSGLRKRLGIPDTSLPASLPDLSGNGNHGTRGDTPPPEPVAVKLTPVSAELTPIAAEPPQEPPQDPQPVSPIVEHAAAEVARQGAAERACATPAAVDSAASGPGEDEGTLAPPPFSDRRALERALAKMLELRAQVADLTRRLSERDDELRAFNAESDRAGAELEDLKEQLELRLRVVRSQAAEIERLHIAADAAAPVDCPAPAEEPLTQEQRGAALLLAAGVSLDAPMDTTVSVWRRVLALAADLAALAERR